MVFSRATPSDLPAWLREHLVRQHKTVAAATVSGGRIQTAQLEAEPDADFELGSLSKALTGLIYANAVGKGQVRPEQTLADFLPLADSSAGALTLGSLATHHSGLSASGRSPLSRLFGRAGAPPAAESVEELLEQARAATVGPAKAADSDLGYQLLGLALARQAGCTFPTLLRRILTKPLKLAGMYAPRSVDELRPTAAVGTNRFGRPSDPSVGEALAPASGIRATAADLGTLIAALLDGSAPGIAALDPVADFDSKSRIGAAWLTLEHRDGSIAWHSGEAGGFRSWIGLDRDKGAGAAIVSATARSVDGHGFVLLNELIRENSL